MYVMFTCGRRTEQAKTGQVNLDHLTGHFRGRFGGRLRGNFRGSSRRAEKQGSQS